MQNVKILDAPYPSRVAQPLRVQAATSNCAMKYVWRLRGIPTAAVDMENPPNSYAMSFRRHVLRSQCSNVLQSLFKSIQHHAAHTLTK